ncbi:hypothetical protein [Novosphingobium sp. Leaf2]|uniref:hypothetical protein n=1 Tax=Novosphingobium sp. Leaf2 TaxID=1735670 RepID=UPI0012E2CD7B|nr:hypothetical protein [Novosphingobium sp. Leaf2]
MSPTDLVKETVKFKQGNLGNQTYSRVCKRCNSGWMKRIQDDVIPTLTPLIKGEWHDMNVIDANRIALWTAVTATVIAMSQDTCGVTTQDRQYFFKNQGVPPKWTVWIGRISGVPEISYCNRVLAVRSQFQSPQIQTEPNTLVTTIEIGQVLLHCVSAPYEDLLPNPFSYGWNMGLLPIHPWGGDILPWQALPILSYFSREHRNVRDFLYAAMVLGHDISVL